MAVVIREEMIDLIDKIVNQTGVEFSPICA
jgi:hypothetical protein